MDQTLQARKEALRRPLVAVLRPVAFSLAAFYAALTLYWHSQLAPQFPALGVAWPAAALVLFAVALAAPRIPSPHVPMAFGLIALVTVTASLNLIESTRATNLATALSIVILGWGMLITSRRWLALVIGTSVAGWFVIALRSGFGPPWHAQTFLILASAIVSGAAQHMHIRRILDGEQLRAAEAARAAQDATVERLRAESRFKSQFLNLVAHELATPMTAITLDASRLTSPSTERLARNVDRLNRALQDVVAITQSSSAALQTRPVDVAAMVRAQAGEHFVVAAEGAIVVAADPAWLGATVERIARVVRALKQPATRGTITATDEGDQAAIQWTFQPAGASADGVRLFEPFVASPDLPGDVRLAIEASREAVHAMQGQWHVRGVGAEIEIQIRLPHGVPSPPRP